MTKEELEQLLSAQSYDFLREDDRLGKRILFLTLSGSHAHGTNGPESDVDVRGCAVLSPTALLGLRQRSEAWGYEQVEQKETDTVVYTFPKFAALLFSCSPQAVEMLSSDVPHVWVSAAGQTLLSNWKVFLSQKAAAAYSGFLSHQEELIRQHAEKGRVEKMNRSMAHLIRVYATACDLLETGEAAVCREKEHQILMDIRNGLYQEAGRPSEKFQLVREEWEKRYQYAVKESVLPEQASLDNVNELCVAINRESLNIL